MLWSLLAAALRPSELLAYNYTESTINLAWVSSSDTRGELDPYMLFIEPRDAEENYLETVGRVVEFKGLKSNTEYQIQLISNLGLMLETSQKTSRWHHISFPFFTDQICMDLILMMPH